MIVDYKKLERRLQRAMERAIEIGWYPARSYYATGQGSCCAIGARAIVEDNCGVDPDPDVARDGLSDVIASSIESGFDGRLEELADDRKAWAIGARLRERYMSPADL